MALGQPLPCASWHGIAGEPRCYCLPAWAYKFSNGLYQKSYDFCPIARSIEARNHDDLMS